jgi:hypothetical protein
MDELSAGLSRAAMTKNQARFCSADRDPSHRIVTSGVNSVQDVTVCVYGGADMAAISDRHHHLVTQRGPIASVAFSGKFWSMQHDCTGSPFGLFSSAPLSVSIQNGESQK